MLETEPNGLDMADLVAKAVAGDKYAFGVIYQEYLTPVYRYIFFRVKSREDADELTQEVFLKALGAFARYEAKRENPLPFFYTIARNTVIDWQKKKKTVDVDDEVFHNIEDEGMKTDQFAILGEEIGALRVAMKELPDDQREAIELRFMGELSGKEVADMMGKSEDAVRQLQSRGLRALKEHFKHAYESA